jgi:hypothetical protein
MFDIFSSDSMLKLLLRTVCSDFQGTWIASIHGHTCYSLKDLLLVICAFSY